MHQNPFIFAPNRSADDCGIIRILIADPDTLFRSAVSALIGTEDHLQVVAEAAQSKTMLSLLDSNSVHVVLLEPIMRHEDGATVLRLLQAKDCLSRTILLTGCEDPLQLTEALTLGAKGIVMKKSIRSQLVSAIRTVTQGRVWLDEHFIKSIAGNENRLLRLAPWWRWFRLTQRQREIVSLILRGYTNKAIAAKLQRRVGTVTSHLHSIYMKLAVRRRQELAAYKRCYDEFACEPGHEYDPVIGRAA